MIVSTIAPITNTAEISADDSALYGTTDIDSVADGDKSNDVYGEDNQTDGNGTDDEDDADIAVIDFTVTAPTDNNGG